MGTVTQGCQMGIKRVEVGWGSLRDWDLEVSSCRFLRDLRAGNLQRSIHNVSSKKENTWENAQQYTCTSIQTHTHIRTQSRTLTHHAKDTPNQAQRHLHNRPEYPTSAWPACSSIARRRLPTIGKYVTKPRCMLAHGARNRRPPSRCSK